MHVLHNVPIPPSINVSYCNMLGRGRVASRQLVAYRRAFATWALQNSHALKQLALIVSEKKITVHFVFRLASSRIITKAGKPKRWDVSNRIKVLEDCLCKALGIDDKWVWIIAAQKEVSPREGVEINIDTLEW